MLTPFAVRGQGPASARRPPSGSGNPPRPRVREIPPRARRGRNARGGIRTAEESPRPQRTLTRTGAVRAGRRRAGRPPVDTVNWGVLGVARIATIAVIPALLRARNARLMAIASRTLPRAQEAAHRLGVPRAYGSYDALLADPDVQAIYIPLP